MELGASWRRLRPGTADLTLWSERISAQFLNPVIAHAKRPKSSNTIDCADRPWRRTDTPAIRKAFAVGPRRIHVLELCKTLHTQEHTLGRVYLIGITAVTYLRIKRLNERLGIAPHWMRWSFVLP